jgi:hypothetical protein
MRKYIMHIKIIVQQVNKPNQDEKYLAYMAEILGDNDLISGAGRMIAPEEIHGSQQYFYHPRQAEMVVGWLIDAIKATDHELVVIDSRLSVDRHRGNV